MLIQDLSKQSQIHIELVSMTLIHAQTVPSIAVTCWSALKWFGSCVVQSAVGSAVSVFVDDAFVIGCHLSA